MRESEKDFERITVRLHKQRDRLLLEEIRKGGARKGAPRLLELAEKGLHAERRTRRSHAQERPSPSGRKYDLIKQLDSVSQNQLQELLQTLTARQAETPHARDAQAQKTGTKKIGGLIQEEQSEPALCTPSTNPALAAMLDSLGT